MKRKKPIDRKDILRILKALERQHGFVSTALIAQVSKRMRIDLRRRIRVAFGGIDKARKIASIEAKPKRWSRLTVLQQLRVHAQAGNLSYTDLRESSPGLKDAVYRYLGGWKAALRRIGITYKRAPRTAGGWKWTSDSIIRTLRIALKAGDVRIEPLRQVHAGLYPAARRQFGSWWEALAVARGKGYSIAKNRPAK